MPHLFAYGQTELGHLAAAYPQFAALIERYENEGVRPERWVEEDVFVCLMRCINDQLISLQAAASIWARIEERFGSPLRPDVLASATVEDIQSCGTSWKKAEYMHDIACKVADGSLDLAALYCASDQEILDALVALRGIGAWTAQMLLIHAFERPDVIAYGDAAIRRGLRMLLDLEQDPSPSEFEKLVEPFRPFATTASIFLWRLSKE